MITISGWGNRIRGLFTDTKGPWGQGGSDTGSDGGGDQPTDDSQGGPWGEPARRARRPAIGVGNVSALEEFLRRSRARFGGGGGGDVPTGRNRSLVLWGVAAVILVWLVATSVHSISPGQSGVVTTFGRYSRTLGPGVSLTLPSPIERVTKLDVQKIQSFDLGSSSADDLMLTGDQNLLELAYQVRWNIGSPELYLFQLSQPDETIREVAESAMRAVVSEVTLNDAMGDKRAQIEARVAENMQAILDSYHSGILVQGIAIKQADPPETVNDAFKQVTAAQQQAQSMVNNANSYSLRVHQQAQGAATAFDKVYDQYKLAPEVTRRRMYYDTMEAVLSKVDKTIVETPGVTTYLPLPQVQKSQPQERQ